MVDFPLNEAATHAYIENAISEDIGGGDITCETVIPADATLTATMNAREDIVLAGLPLAVATFKWLDPKADITSFAADGDRASAGTDILRVKGSARALLGAERTALNIVQHLSGIATLTHRYVDLVQGTRAKILDTRKTIPGHRLLAKYAVAMGGGTNHRIGLHDAVMIKDNHIAVAGSVENAVRGPKAAGRTDIQVECDTLEQVLEAVNAGANSLLLDNMKPVNLRKALSIVGGRIPCEASGGVNLDTVRKIAETGVDYISIGRLTQSAPAVDIGLDFLA